MEENDEDINLVSAKFILKKQQCKFGFVEVLEEGYLPSDLEQFVRFIKKYSVLDEDYEIGGSLVCSNGMEVKEVSLDSFEDWLETLKELIT